MVKNNIRKTQFESEMKDFISLIKKMQLPEDYQENSTFAIPLKVCLTS